MREFANNDPFPDPCGLPNACMIWVERICEKRVLVFSRAGALLVRGGGNL